MEFFPDGSFSLSLIGLSIGLNYFVGSSTSAKSNIALITDQAPVKEGLKGTDGLTFDYKDEAAAKKAMKRGRDQGNPHS